MPKYILNTTEEVAHMSEGLTEQCNTDDIIVRRASDTIPEGYHHCQHCMSDDASEPTNQLKDSKDE